MISWMMATPGRLYVVATILPLAVFAVMLGAGCLRSVCRSHRHDNAVARFLFFLLGGHRPLRFGAYLATGVMAVVAVIAVVNLLRFLDESKTLSSVALEERWSERSAWAKVGVSSLPGKQAVLEFGYRIDHLSALMFAMVAITGTCIFLFSTGYMADETEEHHHDHEAHVKRPGRFGRFFLFLSLFCFSMFNLLIADNLFQVFVSWELVGVCSFFLISFYHERDSAATAANKAFIMNRVGDAGFLIGLAVVWVYFGTFNFQDMFRDLAAGSVDIPNAHLVLAGLGVFLGCVGKSAQFPLQTWLPDAMEGPTPVSALIHAATMVAAGVYLVGRAYPLFTPEVRIVIAYTGMMTLFLGATIALVMTDIKRVLAYSTVSQLGFMMLALGVGGWTAGLLHLLTHAFFKALLFLCSGSVIYGCHHEQSLMKMGGLRRTMPWTAATMLIGTAAIIGVPFLSGWYSKDVILSHAVGFGLHQGQHMALVIIPMITVGLTAFYMSRLWILAFGGSARDAHVAEHAHESPWVMRIPLLILAVFSIGVAWGWPLWDPHASKLGHLLEEARPAVLHGDTTVHENHYAGWIALAIAVTGVGAAVWCYHLRPHIPAVVVGRLRSAHVFLQRKWGFDELYDTLFVGPTRIAARIAARFDKRTVPESDADRADRTVNWSSLDGVISAVGLGMPIIGGRLRHAQSGLVRRYVTLLLLAVAALTALAALAAAV